MNKRLFPIFFILLLLSVSKAKATHIVGGEFTYAYVKDTFMGGITKQKYIVSLSIYEDCLNGSEDAINQDNPAFFSVYDGANFTNPFEIDTNISYISASAVPTGFSNACVSNLPNTCLLKKTFVKTYYLPPNSSGYLIAYQRCCRNDAIINVIDPGNNGSTYYCIIPSTLVVPHNTSAVFKNFPPQIICLNNPLYYDNSATDADGDSLSYGFCSALNGGDNSMLGVKPIPLPPPYDSTTYLSPYTSLQPISGFPQIQINPHTGLITGTPNRLGRYLVTVYCNEYRGDILINTIHREFQFVVTDCSKVVVADIPQYSTDPNTYIVDCSNFTVNFVNISTGGFTYNWDFGVPGSVNDTSSAFEPTFTYPDTGTFTVKLVVNPGSTCPDSIIRLVKIYPYFHADFSDSGAQCPGSPITFKDMSSSTIKPLTYWKWSFGDGDSVFTQNPVHSYLYGGTYNVILISQNVRDCADTVFKQVLVDNFKPFAGNDTIIVKGESVQFNATGGISYAWSPPDNLSATNIYNPVGYYPDTGKFTYYVNVESSFGCIGLDTIIVTVVNNASFFVPNAFSPNGDGNNDAFKPVAVGYRGLTYFRVFNRWGQLVYNSNILEEGWDGTFNNKKADLGTYFWEISFVDRFGKQGFLKGDVLLVR